MAEDVKIVVGAEDRASQVLSNVGKGVSMFNTGLMSLAPIAAGAATAMATVTAGIVAFNQAASVILERAKEIDELAKSANAVGESVAGLKAFQFALGEVAGVGADTARAALEELRKSIGESLQGDQGKTDILTQLGLDAQSLSQAGPVEAFEQVRAALAGVENAAQRAAIAEKLLGGEAKKLMGLLGDTSTAFSDSMRAASDLGLTISESGAAGVESMNDALGRAGAVLDGLITQVTAELAPAIEDAALAFVDIVGPLAEASTLYLPTMVEDAVMLLGTLQDVTATLLLQETDGMTGARMLADLYERRAKNEQVAIERLVERLKAQRQERKQVEETAKAEDVKATAAEQTLAALEKELKILALGREEYERQEQLATATTEAEYDRIKALQGQLQARQELDEQIKTAEEETRKREDALARAQSGVTATEGRLITRGNAGNEQKQILATQKSSLEELKRIRTYIAEQSKEQFELVVVGGGT